MSTLLTDDELTRTLVTESIEGDIFSAYVEPEVLLADVQAAALSRIDKMASDTRAKYISDGVGQEVTYQMKYDEAVTYIAVGKPLDTNAYPMLSAEAGVTNSNMGELAEKIVAKRKLWKQLAPVIEGVRMGGKQAVKKAKDVNAVAEAVASARMQFASLQI